MRSSRPSRRRTQREILEAIERQLQELQQAQQRMEQDMSQAFDNLKASVADAVNLIMQAVERIRSTDDPAAIQAEVNKLNAAVGQLGDALSGV